MGQSDRSTSQKGDGRGSKESVPQVEEGYQNPRTGGRASPTRNILCRTWTTNIGHENGDKSQRVAASALSPAMQRWLGEPMREEPYHAVGAVADAVGSEGGHKKQDRSDSNKAVAGSDEGKNE